MGGAGSSWPELLEMAFRIEGTAEALYRKAAEEMEGEARELFESLSGAKGEHVEMLSSLVLDAIDKADVEYNRGLLRYIERGEEITSSPGSDLVVAEFSINFEEEAIRYFEDLRDCAGPEAESVFTRVIEDNRRHVERIRTLTYETLAGFKSPVRP